MFRKSCSVVLMALAIAGATVSADDGRPPASSSGSSTGKRVMWTVIGAAAGFGAGVYLGLNAFDDAIDSDRKVWTTAIAGAAAGGLAGGLLSRNVGRGARAAVKPEQRLPEISWESALRRTAAIEPPASPVSLSKRRPGHQQER